jgi:dTDP-4-amino-4,6-dideoxygalactose transaminase
VEPGFKYNLPDLLAAIGRVQLTRARALLEKRRCIASAYDRAFGPEKSLLIPPSAPGDARHLYSLRLRAGMDRDSFIRGLREKGIGVSVHFIPLHMMPYYAKRQALLPGDFPEARKNYASCLSLPLWPGMGEERTSRVIAALIRTLREAGEP